MIQRLLKFAIKAGELSSAEDADRDTILRQGVMLSAGSAAIVAMPLLWGSLMLLSGFRMQAGIYYTHSLLQLLYFLYAVRFRRYQAALVATTATLLIQPFIVQWTLGGFAASGATVIWAIGAPLSAPLTFGRRGSPYWLLAYVGLVVVAGIVDPLAAETGPVVPPAFSNFLFVGNIVGSIISFGVFMYATVLQLEAIQKLADSLLLNILPAAIADRLKHDQQTIADSFDEVTILFADIVDFTTMSDGASPVEVVEMLNALFSEFDEISDRHGLEKIKTIGDAYMVAGGLPEPRADHAEAVMLMAHDMLKVLPHHLALNGEPLKLRIGINSGPAVAGVIGHHKFIYDLWGDAVNTASRMESNGLSNVIQVTPTTYEILKDRYDFEQRDPIHVKGKGEMTTYLLRVQDGTSQGHI